MDRKRKYIITGSISLLVFIFISPVILKATHYFFVHHHEVHSGGNKSQHLQELEKCSVCDFHFCLFTSDFFLYPDWPLQYWIQNNLKLIINTVYLSAYKDKLERGPPCILNSEYYQILI